MKRVYLDNAATTPMAPEVIEAMTSVMSSHFGNPSSIHAHGREARALIERARRKVAELTGAAPAEIFFTSGGTEADNHALRRVIYSMHITRVISSPIEHHAVTHTLEEMAAAGEIELIWLNPDTKGRHSAIELNSLLENQPQTLVSLMHANNELGTMIDLEEIGRICRTHNAIFHSDTVQTMGHFAFCLHSTPVDLITCAAHKFHGPKGVGFLYVNHQRVKLTPFITGGAQERNLRAGTENLTGIVGLAKAMELSYNEVDKHIEHLKNLRSYFLAELRNEFPEIVLNGVEDPEMYLPTVLNVCFPERDDNEMFLMKLDIHGISASGGSACSSGSQTGSHVLAGIKAPPNRPCVRFSFSRYTSKEELEYVLKVLRSWNKKETPVTDKARQV
jgi:cysteine desulfurase